MCMAQAIALAGVHSSLLLLGTHAIASCTRITVELPAKVGRVSWLISTSPTLQLKPGPGSNCTGAASDYCQDNCQCSQIPEDKAWKCRVSLTLAAKSVYTCTFRDLCLLGVDTVPELHS